MKNVIGSFLVIVFYTPICFAASELIGTWGNGTLTVCKEHSLYANNACIGATADCSPKTMFARQYTDEWAVQMLMAVTIYESGARFCPIQIEGKNYNKGDAWTEYVELDSSKCLWLCRDGWTGDKCALPTSSVSSCDTSLLKAENYSSIKRAETGNNTKQKLDMFRWSVNPACGVHKTQEHNMILALKRWLPSGHGAVAQQMVVRAQREGWKDMISWAAIYPAGNAPEIIVCKNGYKPNSSKTDCEEISSEICALALSCPDWNSGYDRTQHILKMRDGSSCYEYRCSQQGYAFKDAVNRSCTECVTGMRDGVSPKDGTCVKCDVGNVFDEKASGNGYCSVAQGYSKVDLQYGAGQTRNSNQDLEQQCWTITTPNDYAECVKNGGGKNKNITSKFGKNMMTQHALYRDNVDPAGVVSKK